MTANTTETPLARRRRIIALVHRASDLCVQHGIYTGPIYHDACRAALAVNRGDLETADELASLVVGALSRTFQQPDASTGDDYSAVSRT